MSTTQLPSRSASTVPGAPRHRDLAAAEARRRGVPLPVVHVWLGRYGSTAAYLAHHTACPLLVDRGRRPR